MSNYTQINTTIISDGCIESFLPEHDYMLVPVFAIGNLSVFLSSVCNVRAVYSGD